MARVKIDWEAVELDYRAGVKTLRTMAKEHGCAESAIRKKAKEQNWSRDLAEKVRQRAEEKVRKEEVRKIVRTELDPSERTQIEVMADVQAGVVLSQRQDIRRSRSLVVKLLDELEQQCDNPDVLEKLAEILLAPPEGGESSAERQRREKLWESFHRAISLGGRTDTMKKLADSLKVLVALEREAFNIDGEDDKKGGRIEDWLDELT